MSVEKYRQQLGLVKKARSEDWKKSVEQYSATTSKRFDMLSIGDVEKLCALVIHPCFNLCYIWISDPYSMACTVEWILSTAKSIECIHSVVQSWNVYIPQFVHWMYILHGFSHWMYTFHSYLHSMQHIHSTFYRLNVYSPQVAAVKCRHSMTSMWNVCIPRLTHWMYTFHSYLHLMQYIYFARIIQYCVWDFCLVFEKINMYKYYMYFELLIMENKWCAFQWRVITQSGQFWV